jgi:hypothetical protein
LLPCASTIRRAATVIIITAAKGEAQSIIKGRGARASFMAHPIYIHYITCARIKMVIDRIGYGISRGRIMYSGTAIKC